MFQSQAPALKHEHNCEAIPQGVNDIEDKRKNNDYNSFGYFLRFDLIIVVG